MHILVDIDGVLRGQKDEPIATGSTLFVGTQAECNTHILDCGLHFPDTEEFTE